MKLVLIMLLYVLVLPLTKFLETDEFYSETGKTSRKNHSTKNEQSKQRFLKRIIEIETEALHEVISDSKTLLYGLSTSLIPNNPLQKSLMDQMFALKMYDASYALGTLGLQKDSEFLPIFNHYILKEMESGFLKRLFYEHHAHLFNRESFEMMEPQPLGFNNVMFCFIFLALAICLSITLATIERIRTKLKRQKLWATGTRKNRDGHQLRVRRNRRETGEIRFDHGSGADMDNKNDKIVGTDGDFGIQRADEGQ